MKDIPQQQNTCTQQNVPKYVQQKRLLKAVLPVVNLSQDFSMPEEKIRKVLHCNLFSILTRYTAQKIPCHSTVLETSPCKLFYASKKDLQLVNMVHH